MKYNRIIIIIFSLIGAFYFAFVAGLGFYECTSIALMIYTLLDFIDNLGKKVVVLDIAVILAVFTWLIMPVIFYQYYTKADHAARIFYKYMPIPADSYFSFALPGTIMMIIGMKLKLAKLEIATNPAAYKAKLETYFRGKARIGFILIGISLTSGPLNFIVPDSLSRIVNLLQHLSFVGIFYIFFSGHKRRNLILLVVMGLLLINSVITGMFGELVFLLALIYILLALYLKTPGFWYKFTVMFIGIFAIFVLQSVKKSYREKAWVSGSDFGYFTDLVEESITNPSSMFDKDKLFVAAVRMNQGWLIAVTMDRVPRKYSFANGETVWMSVAAAFVPRVFWPDKPEAGGRYNLKRFWGYDLHGYSMNIGPIGEAYANFDRLGGIVFMFFYGLFFNAMLTMLLKWTEKKPSFLCWIPYLFFYAVVVETDILTTVSSIVTSFFFMLGFMYIFKKITHITL